MEKVLRPVTGWRGGVTFDVLSMFRPGEKLLLDLYDHPADVKRVARELHELFYRFYAELAEAMQAARYGCSDWSRIYCEQPCHMLSTEPIVWQIFWRLCQDGVC